MKKVAIIGSTGMLGIPVTKAFINAGFDVSILVRNPIRAIELFESKVRIVKGDLKELNSLQELLVGQDAVYLSLSVEQNSSVHDFQAEREGLQNLLKIAATSNIKRIGYLSSLIQFFTGLNWWVLDIKKDAVQKIKESGLAYSIFYPSTFMESFDKGAFRQGNNITIAGQSKFPMYLIAGCDYGKQVVKSFENDYGNNEYIVQGQDGYLTNEAARLFAKHNQKEKIKVIKVPIGLLKFLGRFTKKFNYAANILEILNNFPEKFESENTWQKLGKPQTKLIDYIRNS